MKKLFTLLVLAITLITSAQAPQGFNYQATVRNSSGALIVNQNVLFKFNIMQNSQTSLPVYSETHSAPTDDLGQVNLTVGTGTATTGTFAGINWGSGTYYLGIELNTGANFVAMGTTQLLSVPYALYANSAGSSQSQGKPSIYLTGDITNAEAAARIASQLGPVTENIYIENTTQLTTVDLSAMEYASDISIRDNNVLTSINLSGLKECYRDLQFISNPLLTTISFPVLTYSRKIDLYGNALSIATINVLLNKMLSVLPSTGKYIVLSGQNPPAPPSGQGIIDKQTLIDSGNSVYTDGDQVEIITTVRVTLVGGGQTIILESKDLDGDGPNAPVVTVSGNLLANTSYTGAVTFLNEIQNPAEDITAEVEAEGVDYQVFYQLASGLGTITYTDLDLNGKPIGLTFTLTTGNAGTGNLTVTLRHLPNKSGLGVASGDITNAGGSTDAVVTYPVWVN
jgi:hypothetical protein